jgi:hypothetical protein
MTLDYFRRLALTMPEALEVGHMGHPDFRVGGKIFATLGYPDERWAMVKLTPEQQEAFVAADPVTFVPVKGGWGRAGCHQRAAWQSEGGRRSHRADGCMASGGTEEAREAGQRWLTEPKGGGASVCGRAS